MKVCLIFQTFLPMHDFPDFSSYGYCIEQELGANRLGGRVTYLARELKLDRQVVIKQFQFARLSSSWSAYDSHQREIQVLRTLKHVGIPCYLNSFQVTDGFCMVQEYKAAYPLSVNRSFGPEEIRTIAIKVLEILIYLQHRIPPIIHRDLKPNNILVDEVLNVFVVDFGFARIGDGEVGVSSVVKGTLGFMPPEQLFNRQLTEASDLYGLGMTLICLLTRTKTDDIGDLVDISYKVRFKHLVPKLSVHWVKWLEKMVDPRVKERFQNAQEALKALPDSYVCPPEIQLSHCDIYFQAAENSEILIHHLKVMNLVAGIQLTGTWKVQTHPNDLVAKNEQHPWIDINPQAFKGNQVECCVTVHTSKLKASEIYHRTLVLQTNAMPQTYSIPIQVKTAPIPIQKIGISLYPLLMLFTGSLGITRIILGISLFPEQLLMSSPEVVSLGLLIGAVIGLQGAAWLFQHIGGPIGLQLITIATACFSVPTLVCVWLFLDTLTGSWDAIFSGLIPGIFGGWLLGLGAGLTAEKLWQESTHKTATITLVLLTSFLSVSWAIGLAIGFTYPLTLLATTGFSIALLSLLLQGPLSYASKVAAYRRAEKNRIRP